MTEDNDINKLNILYSNIIEVVKMFSGARDAAITRFFTAIIATVAMAGWFYNNNEKEWTFVPFFIAFVISLATHMITKLNSNSLNKCYHVGKTIEQKLSSNMGIFKAINDMYDTKDSPCPLLRRYHQALHSALHSMCLFSAFIFLIAAITTFIELTLPPACHIYIDIYIDSILNVS